MEYNCLLQISLQINYIELLLILRRLDKNLKNRADNNLIWISKIEEFVLDYYCFEKKDEEISNFDLYLRITNMIYPITKVKLEIINHIYEIGEYYITKYFDFNPKQINYIIAFSINKDHSKKDTDYDFLIIKIIFIDKLKKLKYFEFNWIQYIFFIEKIADFMGMKESDFDLKILSFNYCNNAMLDTCIAEEYPMFLKSEYNKINEIININEEKFAKNRIK
jgi:hypothetical protein